MNYSLISPKLRQILKERRISYKNLANQLNMSESGVKKMLTGKDLSINKLDQILKIIQIDMKTLLDLTFNNDGFQKLSSTQNKFLLENKKYYNFYSQLTKLDMDIIKLQRINNLSSSKVKIF